MGHFMPKLRVKDGDVCEFRVLGKSLLIKLSQCYGFISAFFLGLKYYCKDE